MLQEWSDQVNLKWICFPMEKHTHLWSLFDVWVNWIMICQYMSHHVKSIIVSLKSQDFHLFGVLLSCFHVALFIQCCPSQWHHGHHRNPQVCGSKAGNFFPTYLRWILTYSPWKPLQMNSLCTLCQKTSPRPTPFYINFPGPNVIRGTGPYREKKKHKPPPKRITCRSGISPCQHFGRINFTNDPGFFRLDWKASYF